MLMIKHPWCIIIFDVSSFSVLSLLVVRDIFESQVNMTFDITAR
ncbi:hypothetical protein EL75_4939 [Escherichia coli]|nr:hypothetical protein EL75_4939 [Escherichia coli]